MGDQQLSPIDLTNIGRGVSFYSADQPQMSKALGSAEDEGRMFGSSSVVKQQLSARSPSSLSSTSASSPSVVKQLSKSPSFSCTPMSCSSAGDQAQMEPVQTKPDGSTLLDAITSMHNDSLDQQKPEFFALMTTGVGNGAVAEANLNSVITSLGLMQVGNDCAISGPSTSASWSSVDRQGVAGLQGSANSNFQNLSPAIYQLLAQSQLPSRKWPPQLSQQSFATGQRPTYQNNVLPNNLQSWNGNLQSNLLSHYNNFNTLWGQNQQQRIAESLSSNADSALLFSKLQPKALFGKNYQQSASHRPVKTISEENGDVLNQVHSGHDAELLKLAGVDTSALDLSGLSQSQDQLKGIYNWTVPGRQSTPKEASPFGFLDKYRLLENGSLDQVVPNLVSIQGASPNSLSPLRGAEHYSRKVFVGGLPPDIDEEEITAAFRRFGQLIVDWPHKAESKSYFPPKGYCFLLFQDEFSVLTLIDACVNEDGKYFWFVSSPTMKDKMVQIRPWNLSDSDFVLDGSQPLDPRKTIFVGGVPRPLRAFELAVIMERLYGGVCYAGIDTDPELKYPKGAGRVAFSSQQSYIAAISARFVQLQHGEIDKRVEVKPYVLDDQLCDECQGIRCGGRFAPFFCANVTCLQYYCQHCWSQIHSRPGREFHKPLVKEGADRPRSLPFRWC